MQKCVHLFVFGLLLLLCFLETTASREWFSCFQLHFSIHSVVLNESAESNGKKNRSIGITGLLKRRLEKTVEQETVEHIRLDSDLNGYYFTGNTSDDKWNNDKLLSKLGVPGLKTAAVVSNLSSVSSETLNASVVSHVEPIVSQTVSFLSHVSRASATPSSGKQSSIIVTTIPTPAVNRMNRTQTSIGNPSYSL